MNQNDRIDLAPGGTGRNEGIRPAVDFLLIGATKSGTESIYEYFSRRSDSVWVRDKQQHYFCQGIFGRNYDGLEREITLETEYRNAVRRARAGQMIGDFDALTLHGPRAPELVYSINPKVKALAILRNPIERAYSHYWMDVRECLERRSFYETIREDFEKYQYSSEEYCPTIRLSFYAEKIEGFRAVLGPSQVRVWLYDDLCASQERVLREMCQFIGLEYVEVPGGAEIRENVAAIPRTNFARMLLEARRRWLAGPRQVYLKLPRRFRRWVKKNLFVRTIKVPPMSQEARRFLVGVFQEDILRLEKSLGRDLSHWLRDPDEPIAMPELLKERQKEQQAKYFDDVTDDEFEVERPNACGRLYQRSLASKFEIAEQLLAKDLAGEALLDVCCGSGMGAEHYARRGARVTGIDISSKAIERARLRAARHQFSAAFVVGDAENLPFADRQFSYVTVHDGLHHLPNPHLAIAEMARIASKAIIVIEPARSWLTKKAVAAGLALDFEDAGNYVYRFREDEIFRIAKARGMEILSWRQYMLYYKHEPFRFHRYIDHRITVAGILGAFQLVSVVAPRLGNKICVVCSRK